MTRKLSFSFFFSITVQCLFAATLPPGFTETRIAKDLDPTSITITPDGKVLVTVKSGKILVIKNDTLLATPLLTIPHVDSWNERGLISAMLDPGFDTNGYIYTYYTYKDPTSKISNNRVSRFTVKGNVADTASQLVLINFDQLTTVGWHNGGGLVYGLDGKIYASTGENSNTSHSQSLSSLLGKVVRINPDGSIPKDNPFYNLASGKYKAIYALGLRNPWRMEINNSGTIYLNDVGANNWEEINEVKAGRNYGWPLIEGKRGQQTPPENYEEPLFSYSHDTACAITGGAFYNPSTLQFPLYYKAKYFFMDYCAGWIRHIDPMNNYTMSQFATGIDRPLDIAVDNKGNVYYLSRGGIGDGSDEDNSSTSEGELWRISYTGSGNVDIGLNPSNKSVAAGAQVTFVTSATGKSPLQYQWQRDGVDIKGATSYSYTLPSVTLADSNSTFRVIVSNAISSATSSAAILKVFKNTPPIPTIASPLTTYLYEAGYFIYFSGSATDKEDGELADSAFTWAIHFHHDTHFHPALDPISGIRSGTYDIPNEGEVSDTVWYRILLTVKDKLGTSTTVYRDIYPKKATVTLNTAPSGIPLFLDGSEQQPPLTYRGVVGLKRNIEAKKIVKVGGITYAFQKWSNQGRASQALATPKTNTTYTATFVKATIDTLPVEADAYVRGGTGDTITFGTTDSTHLLTKNGFSPQSLSHVYLRFSLDSTKKIIGAKLRLFGGKDLEEGSDIRTEVYGVNELKWNEDSITWHNRPKVDSVMLDSTMITASYKSGQYFEWDVSDYVIKAKQDGAGAVSFSLSNFEATMGDMIFNSKEARTNKPQLVITSPDSPLEYFQDGIEEEVLLFPNPFTTSFIVQEEGPFDYSIYDLMGTLLLNGKGQNLANVGSSLSAGTYVVKIHGHDGNKIGKVIKL